MMRNDIYDNIEKIIQSLGASLYDIEVVSEFDETIFRVMITKQGGVNLDDCAEVSRELSLFLDVNPPIENEYRLEVSSPGIERKLINPKHFIQSIGEKVKLKIAEVGQVIGLLKDANEKDITVETDGEMKTFTYSQINKARTYFEW
ncbi:Ribosome maturation factor RimP [Sulfurovum sp. enrichment culture clone C5]|uniref:Ribosome maturation factor RimP n=1 Tax=Sulfurovum sp. enrichment culture clone C5 TaxID=497650 RepID=A0A0S4XN53_9BACT|nr:Ribosome maturation factor RimP [Sulfurovum sp. enrichment culture clone C5]